MNDQHSTIEIATDDGLNTVRLAGAIDAHTGPALLSSLDLLLDPISNACLDLSGVTFMDSSGLGILILQWMRFDKEGGRLEITNLSSMMRRLVDISGMSDVFDPPVDEPDVAV